MTHLTIEVCLDSHLCNHGLQELIFCWRQLLPEVRFVYGSLDRSRLTSITDTHIPCASIKEFLREAAGSTSCKATFKPLGECPLLRVMISLCDVVLSVLDIVLCELEHVDLRVALHCEWVSMHPHCASSATH